MKYTNTASSNLATGSEIILNNCKNCSKETKTKFCSKSCSASFNNRNRKSRVNKICHNCGKHLNLNVKKFCSIPCSAEFRSNETIKKWLNGELKHLPNKAKDFILQEQNYSCNICGLHTVWNDIPIVFILDHIDGNPYNHTRDNLRVVCPNCDSQLPTYKAKNRGKGRHARKVRAREGKSF